MRAERAAELLSRLTAKVQYLGASGGHYGALGPHDFAAALGMVKAVPAALWILRIKYADQIQWRGNAETEIVAEIERGALLRVVDKIAAPQNWKVPRKDFLRDMCRLALYEATLPNLCRKCEGQGWIQKREGPQERCKRCDGTGAAAQKSDAWRARQLSIPRESFRDSWKDRYQAICKLLAVYETVGLSAVARRLY